MDINSITLAVNQVEALHPPSASSNKTDTPAANSSLLTGGQTQTGIPQAQMLSISNSINYIKTQLDSILIDYPPFFPAGSPQRIDLIKGIKGIQEKIEKSSIPSDLKKNLEGPRLTDQASDSDISAALKGLTRFRDFSLPNTSSTQAKEAGTVINIKI